MAIDMKYKMKDFYRHRMETDKLIVERKKEALRIQAEREAIIFLRKLGVENTIIEKKTVADIIYGEDNQFNGCLNLFCKGFVNNYEVNIDVPVKIVDDGICFPEPESITKTFPLKVVKSSVVESNKKDIKSSLTVENYKNVENNEKFQYTKIAQKQISDLLSDMKYYNVKFHKECNVLLSKNSDKTYSGRVDVFVKLSDNHGVKEIKIPVVFASSVPVLPEKLILEKEIVTKKSDVEKTEEELKEELETKIKKIDEEQQYKEEETLKALNICSPVQQASPIEKQANDSRELKVTEYATIIHINKSILPDTLKVGDILNIEGMPYKIINEDGNLLSNVGTSSMWGLQMVDLETEVEIDYKVRGV